MIALSRPSPGNITQAFGPRPKPTPTSPAIHYGIDFGWGNGTEIFAAADGVVTSTSYSGAYGNRTIVNHSGGIETWYCHQSAQAVKVGDTVKRGQHIGTQGATGNVVGMHLHFELRINGVATDPALYMSSTAGSGNLTPVKELIVTEEERAALFEIKRMLGVLLGWPGAANAAEVVAQNAPVDAAESRRMLAEILTGAPAPAGAPAEAALWSQLRAATGTTGTAQIDYAALAKAVNDDAAQRLAN